MGKGRCGESFWVRWGRVGVPSCCGFPYLILYKRSSVALDPPKTQAPAMQKRPDPLFSVRIRLGSAVDPHRIRHGSESFGASGKHSRDSKLHFDAPKKPPSKCKAPSFPCLTQTGESGTFHLGGLVAIIPHDQASS